MQLFDMVHESENIQNKIKANDLYDTITVQNLSQHIVIKCDCENPTGLETAKGVICFDCEGQL